MPLVRIPAAFDHPDWIFELKHVAGILKDVMSYRVALRRLLLVAAALVGAGCGSSTSPTPAPAPAVCTFTITIGMFPIAPPTPGQGMVWTTYFAATILPSQATVYLVDVNAAPSGCLTSWTAVSANTSAVQLSPAGGSGRGQVELFMPANLGTQRSTDVTIAGQRATIMQAGR